MLTCIARSKQAVCEDSPSTAESNAIKTLSSQIKDMALKASGAYRHCAPCASQPVPPPPRPEAVAAEKFRWAYRRTGSSSSGRRELEARLKGISSGEGTPASASGRRLEPVVFVQESEPKEWVAQVEPGVLITFLSLPRGGNDLKRIRFSMRGLWERRTASDQNSQIDPNEVYLEVVGNRKGRRYGLGHFGKVRSGSSASTSSSMPDIRRFQIEHTQLNMQLKLANEES